MTRKKATTIEAIDRALPHDLEAEGAILGAVLVHNDAFDVAARVVTSATFYRDAHRRIWETMADLRETGTGIDFVTLREALGRRGDLDEIGGPAYLSGLASGVPRSVNVEFYARIVVEKALLRGIIFTSNAALSSAYAADLPADCILTEADRAFLDLRQRRSGDLASIGSHLSGLIAGLEHRSAHRGELLGITTGFEALNRMTFGWRRGELVVIGARPSIGKSTLLLNTLMAAAATGAHAALFSFEMSHQELEHKIVASLSGVPLERIEGGFFAESEYPKLAEAFETMRDLPLSIDDTAVQTIHQIRAACRRQQAEGRLDIVGIDYVQLMPGNLDRKGATRNEELTDISRRAKTLAGELNIPVLLLSQLKRLEGSKGGSVKPKLDDLRECGALEQDANTVVLLHRKSHRESGSTDVIFEKQRSGPTGTVDLYFDRETATFKDPTTTPST